MTHGLTTLLALTLAAPALADHAASPAPAPPQATAPAARMSLDEAREAVLRFRETSHVPLHLLIELAGEKNERVRHATAEALRSRGPSARAALPVLVRSLGGDGDSFVIDLLVSFGHDVVVPLAQRLDDPKARRAVLETITRLGPVAGPAAGPVAGLLADADPEVRQAAARALGAMHAEAAPAVAALTTALDDRERWVRIEAVRALGNVGTAASDALDRIALLFVERDPYLRLAAAEAYWAISNDAAVVLPIVTASLKSPDLETLLGSVRMLYHMGPAAAPAVDALAEAARRPEWLQGLYESPSVPMALWRIGERGAPALAAMVRDRRLDVSARNDAARCLGMIGPDARATVPALAAALADDGEAVRSSVVGALGDIGPASAAAVPRLLDVLRRETDAERRSLVAGTVADLVPHVSDPAVAAAAADAVIPLLLADLTRDPDPPPEDEPGSYRSLFPPDDFLRRFSAEAMAELGVRAQVQLLEALKTANAPGRAAAARALGFARIEAAVPALVEALTGDKDAGVREDAAAALSRIGVREGTVAPLVAATNDADDDVREAAAAALVELKADAAVIVPALAALVADPGLGDYSRRDVLRLLGDLGPSARPAAPVLVSILNAPRHPNRTDAAVALARTGGTDAEVLLPVVRACFADDWLKVREDGAGIARALGPAAKGLVPDLVILLDDGSYQVRAAAADALAAIGPAAEPAAGDVATLYRTRLDTESRVAALRALGVLERGGDADALLRQALRDDNATVAFAAAEVVHRRGGDVSAVFPRVRRELRRRSADSYGEALAAAELLAELGAKAARLLPELRRMRDDPAEIPEVRRAVARAVEAITGADQ